MVEDGRVQDGIGVVPLLVYDKDTKQYREPDPIELANLCMKAHTKANRRAALDAVGLGIPDESELSEPIDVTSTATVSQTQPKRAALEDLITSSTPELS
jgi:hypothetical protein